jgi:hypothetical protein
VGQTEISGHCYVKNGELDVVDFACAKSRCVGILHNLSDMHQEPLASFGLRLDRVPVVYQRLKLFSQFCVPQAQQLADALDGVTMSQQPHHSVLMQGKYSFVIDIPHQKAAQSRLLVRFITTLIIIVDPANCNFCSSHIVFLRWWEGRCTCMVIWYTWYQSCLVSQWYALGTIPTCRPKQAEGFRCILVKLQKSQWLRIYKVDDSPHIQSQWHSALHSTASNCHNTWCSRSVPPVAVSTSSPVLHSYLWSSLRSFPIPWPCLLPFHCKLLFHILFYTTYYHFPTVALLIHCLVVISWALVSVLPIV